MSVVRVQPQSQVFRDDAAQWSTGLCFCCRDCGQCCWSLWCFPCISCWTVRRMEQCLCLPLLDTFSACCCIHPIAMTTRATTRERYGIQGSFCGDCLLSTCCCCCVYCQLYRELDHRQLPSMLSDIVQRK
ncbi:unnamed protein product [Knipowitschia caucasica]|uniref:Uncharacterized protein n=1 Tax=Knipowitschia caucasica TaxID=637954 RepID=A0AAV2JBR8_KNICA